MGTRDPLTETTNPLHTQAGHSSEPDDDAYDSQLRGVRSRRKGGNFARLAPPCSTNPPQLRGGRQGDARPPPATSCRGRGQKEVPPRSRGLPRHDPFALFGPRSPPFLRAGLCSRTVGPSPTTHQGRPCPGIPRRACASPPRRGQHCGRRHHTRLTVSGSPASFSVEKEGRRSPTGVRRRDSSLSHSESLARYRLGRHDTIPPPNAAGFRNHERL